MKNLLLKIPYFRKLQESIDEAKKQQSQYEEKRAAWRMECSLWEKSMDDRDAEIARLEEICENLLDAQKIRSLRMSRQTF